MSTRRTIALLIALAAVCAASSGCLLMRPADHHPTTTMDLGSFRLTMDVEPDGKLRFSGHEPLSGTLDIGTILDVETSGAESIQLLLHRGRYYLTSDGFRNVWEITPTPGTTDASFRPISIRGKVLSGVRLTRYGPPGRACVRVDAEGVGPWFVTAEGEVHEECE